MAMGERTPPRAGHAVLARATARALLRLVDGDSIVLTERRRSRRYGDVGGLMGDLTIHDPATYIRTLRRGSIGFGLSYGEGAWDTTDLTTLLRVLYRQTSRLDRFRTSQVGARARARRSARSPEEERTNVARHYDVSNDFFATWLDPSMAYSCAVFDPADIPLEEAQARKLDLVCDRLDLGPGDHLLDIGCGWGSLVLHAAETRGCRATGLTVSREQHHHVVEAIETRGLAGQVDVRLEDMREHRGHYDKIASIEMIEALSGPHQHALFDAIARLVTPAGRIVVQAIVIDDAYYETAQAQKDFIREVIFPDGSLPSRGSLARHAGAAGLARADRLEIGAHYPRTLAAWRNRLAARSDVVGQLGFDDTARRLWEFYFAYCEAGFMEGHIGVVNDVYLPEGASAAHR